MEALFARVEAVEDQVAVGPVASRAATAQAGALAVVVGVMLVELGGRMEGMSGLE